MTSTTPATDPKEELFRKYESLKDLPNFNTNIDNFKDLIGEVGASLFKHKLARAQLEVEPLRFIKHLENLYKEFIPNLAYGLGQIVNKCNVVEPRDEYKTFIKSGSELINERYHPKKDEDD